MNELVSIIIPIYNIENYISKCLKSVLNQTYKDIEIILVNDGSTDKSVEIIEKLKNEKCKIYNKENGGLSSARNYGLNQAKGNYIFFLDGDDYLEKDAIENLVFFIKKYDVDIVQGEATYCYEKNKVIDKLNIGLIETDKVIEYFRENQIKTYVWNKLYKKEILYNLSFKEGYVNEDIIFTYEICALQPKIYNINIPIYNYIQRSNSIMHQTTLDKKIRVLKSHDFVIKKCDSNETYKSFALLNKYISCIYLMVDLKNNKLKYTEKDFRYLIDSMNKSKKCIDLNKIFKYLNKKKFFLYLLSSISINFTTILFRIWRAKK